MNLTFDEAYSIAKKAMEELADIYPDAQLGYQIAGRPVHDIVAARMADAFIAADHTSGSID